jgi:hypothetical protein
MIFTSTENFSILTIEVNLKRAARHDPNNKVIENSDPTTYLQSRNLRPDPRKQRGASSLYSRDNHPQSSETFNSNMYGTNHKHLWRSSTAAT